MGTFRKDPYTLTSYEDIMNAVRRMNDEMDKREAEGHDIEPYRHCIEQLVAYSKRCKRVENSQPKNCFYRVKATCERNGVYPWDLTWDEAKAFADKPCHDCGHIPSSTDARWAVRMIDPALGYTASNVVPVCVKCSYINRHLRRSINARAKREVAMVTR